MRKNSYTSSKQFDQALIEQSYEVLVNEHRQIVHNYEERIKNYEKITQAQKQVLDCQDRLIANYHDMFEMLKQQFPETREVLDQIEIPQR